MKKIIYIEKNIENSKRVNSIISKYKNSQIILVDKYTEIFNKKNQHFKLQKINPAIILAKKHKNFLSPTPSKYTIGNKTNYYFSHMYNCVFDCKYCFLQGLYKSANYVIFVNYEDYFNKIGQIAKKNHKKQITFFSGYDCDSLAYNPYTGFIEEALNFFDKHKNAELEIRTKSSIFKPLLFKSIDNVVIAYSFTPDKFSKKYEAGVPNVEKRLNTIKKLLAFNWKIGIRFDPILIYENWQSDYKKLFHEIFNIIPQKNLHSVTYGNLRFPKHVFKRIEKIKFKEPLFFNLKLDNNLYEEYEKEEIESFCKLNLEKYVKKEKIFSNL